MHLYQLKNLTYKQFNTYRFTRWTILIGEYGPKIRKSKKRTFEEMKYIIGEKSLLLYPDLSKEFMIHTDASTKEIGDVISQSKCPIVFYSRKLTPVQTRYTTTDHVLLSNILNTEIIH